MSIQMTGFMGRNSRIGARGTCWDRTKKSRPWARTWLAVRRRVLQRRLLLVVSNACSRRAGASTGPGLLRTVAGRERPSRGGCCHRRRGRGGLLRRRAGPLPCRRLSGRFLGSRLLGRLLRRLLGSGLLGSLLRRFLGGLLG